MVSSLGRDHTQQVFVEDLDLLFPLLLFHFTQWASADADIKVLSVRQLVLSRPFFLTPRVGQNIALHASHAAKNSAFLYSHFIQLHIIKLQMACIITVNQIFTCDVVNCVL